MGHITTDGIIYKIVTYSDSSCIATAFTEDYGKLKLFMPKAFSKRSGITKFVPAKLDILRKENRDLSKLYSYTTDPKYLPFLEAPEITIRLNLLFDIIDSLLPLDENYDIIYKMILRMTRANIQKATIFTIHAVLKLSGNLTDFYYCKRCNNTINDSSLYLNGDVICTACTENNTINNTYSADNYAISSEVNLILRALLSKELYQNMIVTRKQDENILDLFVKHTEFVLGRKLKSYRSFRELISTL